jgi:hypothetical protein
VRARIGFRTIPGVYGWERRDVLDIFLGPPASAYSGYGISVLLRPGPNRVVLEAEVAGAGWIPFQRQDYVLPWPAAAQGLARRLRFELGRRLGSPGAWRALTAADRDFLLGELEQTGGHPLRLEPHYAPRPVAPEIFPSPSSRPAGALPAITIVTPTFQQRSFLADTMQSVLDQSGANLEYIVEDGGSTDGSAELLAAYAPRLKRARSEPDRGQADALRRGFADCAGRPEDVMAYLNSDDLLMPGAARFVAEYFARHPEVDVVFGHRVLIDEAGAEVGRWYTPRAAVDDLPWLDLIPQETLFWRKRIWDRAGGMDPAFQFAMDWDLLLRFQAAGAKFARLPYFLGQFRLHSAQKSQAKLLNVGIPEMDLLRLRAHGRRPEQSELNWRALRAQMESCSARERLKQGWRW